MTEYPVKGKQVIIPASIELLDNLFEEFSLFMKDFNVKQKDQEEWKVIFMEAITNVIKHSSLKDTEHQITVAWSIRGEEIWLEVYESGTGPAETKIEEAKLPDDPLQTSGRGLHLIYSLSDSYQHWTSKHGYKQIIVKKHPSININLPEDNLLNSALNELSLSYESLTAFYQLGESLINTESAAKFISQALTNLKNVVKNDAIFLTTVSSLEQSLLADIKALNIPTINLGELPEQEIVWENTKEAPDHPLLSPYSCGILCPIRAANKVMGVLALVRIDKPYLIAGELNTIRTFADLLGIAIAQANNAIIRDQAQRAFSELEIAASLQRKLLPLPNLPVHDTWQLFTERKSAREIAGDYVDAAFNNYGSLFLITIDVMGKGVPAAFLASMIRTCFRIQLDIHKELSPLVHSINKILCQQIQDLTIFATCAIAHIPQPYKKIEIVNAGHCPPLIYRNKELIHQIEPSGPPIGIFADSNYSIETFDLEKHDKLFMVTDGLFEWQYNQHIWGWDNFLRFIPQQLEETPLNLWNNLQNKIKESCPEGDVGDDQTMLIWELNQ